MPAKKNNRNESSPFSDSSFRGAFHQPETGNHICLSRAPSIFSVDCGSCCSLDSCHLDNLTSVDPRSPIEVQTEPEKGKCDKCGLQPPELEKGKCDKCGLQPPELEKGKCDKCGLQPPDTHVGIQTSKNQISSPFPCIRCGGSTGVLLNKPKCGLDTERSSFVIPANSKCPSGLERTSLVHPMTSKPACNDERCRPQPVEPPPLTTPLPPSPPPKRGCEMSGCPTNCGHEEQNDEPPKIPGHSFGMPPCAIPKRQSSNIGRNFSTSVLRNKRSDSKHIWNKLKCSKTSVISECKCQPKQCLCHLPPAYEHYFQCTGAITGVCCCSENK